MIQLETPYTRELVPGLRAQVSTRLRARTLALTQTKDGPTSAERDKIISEFDQWTPEQVYAQCPFESFLNTYPRRDFTKLFEWEKQLQSHMEKDLSVWVNNIIATIQNQLWPKRNPFTNS